MEERETTILRRDCHAVLIPAGTRVALPAGEEVTITQALGGSHTVMARGQLVRIDAADADALGKEAPKVPQNSTALDRVDEEQIWGQLKTCYDPEIPVDIVNLGLVYDLVITPLPGGGNSVQVKMTLTAPGCGMGAVLADDVRIKLLQIPGVNEADVQLVWDPPWNRDMMSEAAKLELGML
jgi:probable FeS assembly SUF system protein SufT